MLTATTMMRLATQTPSTMLIVASVTQTPSMMRTTSSVPLTYRPSSTKAVVYEERGLKEFMSRIYTRMGLGITASIGTGLLTMPLAAEYPLQVFGAGAVLGLGSVFGITKIQPILKQEKDMLRTENTPLREACYWGMAGGMGLVMAPMIGITQALDPSILPTAMALSGGIFGTCAYVSTRVKDATMMAWKVPLSVGLASLIGTQVIGLASMFFLGPNMFSSLLHNVDIYGGIALFTAMSIYDSHAARKHYRDGNADHLGCATTFYLDFINLFIRIMEVLSRSKKN